MNSSTHAGFGIAHTVPPVSVIDSALGRSSPPRHVAVGRRPFQSLAAEVGHIAEPSDDEDSLASMRSSNAGSSYRKPDRIKPADGKVSENGGEGRLLVDSSGASVSMRRPCSGNVLPDDDTRANFRDDPPLLAPQTASFTLETTAIPKVRQIGAGRSAVQDINVWDAEGATDARGSHVTVSKSVGPSFGEDAEAVRVRLDLEARLDTESLVS